MEKILRIDSVNGKPRHKRNTDPVSQQPTKKKD